MCKWLARLLPVILMSFPGLRAQENLVPLADVVRRVVNRDPGVRAREAERQAARAEAQRTETLRLPKFYLSTDLGAGKLVNDVADVLLTGLSPASVNDPRTRSRLAELSSDRPYVVPGGRLENNIFDGGRTSAAIRAARLTEDRAEVEKSRTLEDEAYGTASDFLSLARGQILTRYLEDYTRVADVAAAALAEQARAGRITEALALSGRAKFQAALAALENNRDELRLLSDLLRERAGLPAQAAFDTRALETKLSAFGSSEIPESPALAKNPASQTAALEARIQEQQVRAAKSRRLPEVRFVAEYGFTFSSLLFTFRPGYNVGVRASYPVFTSREVERSVQTEARRLDAARLREEKTGSRLREEYVRLQFENRKLGRQLDAARSQLVQAEEIYRVARLKYDQGAGSPSDLLEAAEVLLNSRQHCLEQTGGSVLLRWAALRFQGGLLAELESGTLP